MISTFLETKSRHLLSHRASASSADLSPDGETPGSLPLLPLLTSRACLPAVATFRAASHWATELLPTELCQQGIADQPHSFPAQGLRGVTKQHAPHAHQEKGQLPHFTFARAQACSPVPTSQWQSCARKAYFPRSRNRRGSSRVLLSSTPILTSRSVTCCMQGSHPQAGASSQQDSSWTMWNINTTVCAALAAFKSPANKLFFFFFNHICMIFFFFLLALEGGKV